MRARVAPTTITVSFWLWVATGVVLALDYVLGAANASAAALPASQQQYASIAQTAGVIGGLLAGALHVLFAVFLLRGKFWARVVLTVVGALALIGMITSAASGDLLSMLNVVLTVVAGVLMYLPASNAYVRRRA